LRALSGYPHSTDRTEKEKYRGKAGGEGRRGMMMMMMYDESVLEC
jgi:hypothetical protein